MWAHRALRTAQPRVVHFLCCLAATALCDLQAPEVFSSNYSYKADMWSVGITLYWCVGIGSGGKEGKFAVCGKWTRGNSGAIQGTEKGGWLFAVGLMQFVPQKRIV